MTTGSKKRVLVLGSAGMLGSMVCETLRKSHCEVIGIARQSDGFNANDPGCTQKLSALGNLDLAINCIAVTNAGETDVDSLFRVNALFPCRLANWAERHSVNLIHVSTDGVFRPGGTAYSESAEPDPDDLYGLSKFLGE